MSSYSPGRPSDVRDVVQTISGQPVFLGVITSTNAAAVNNATTATPFSTLGTAGLKATLAGRVLLLQPTAAGCILPNPSAVPMIAQQSATPALTAPFVIPGVSLGAGERVEITMGQTTPFLDFIAAAGTTASLLVWEMV